VGWFEIYRVLLALKIEFSNLIAVVFSIGKPTFFETTDENPTNRKPANRDPLSKRKPLKNPRLQQSVHLYYH
jgi:hypothetical protein